MEQFCTSARSYMFTSLPLNTLPQDVTAQVKRKKHLPGVNYLNRHVTW